VASQLRHLSKSLDCLRKRIANLEKVWDKALIARGELDDLRQDLEQYSNALAKIAGVTE
jgi:hypothetical protein